MIHVVKIEVPLPGEKLLIRLSEIVAEKGVSGFVSSLGRCVERDGRWSMSDAKAPSASPKQSETLKRFCLAARVSMPVINS